MALSAGSWSPALTTYASGLRSDDPEIVSRAFASMSDAEEFERQAYALMPGANLFSCTADRPGPDDFMEIRPQADGPAQTIRVSGQLPCPR
jgi:hypothetical protein